jgi:serine protease Do
MLFTGNPMPKSYRISRQILAPLSLLLLVSAACSASKASETVPVAGDQAERPAIEASLALHAASGASIADVVESVLPSVVSIRSTKKVQQRPQGFFFGQQQGEPQEGLGSGVILSQEGVVVTNNHVIEGADTVVVQLHDGREFKAKVVGADPKSDVAVLQLEGEVHDLIPIRIGDSGALRLGDVVLAVGNPFGVGQTVTMGIVSATGRSDMGIVDYENFIQTDAAINPGNSGGALINMRGELVGINTAILSRSGGSVGIGFAIPTNMAEPIVEALRTHGKVTRGWLGVSIQDLDADLKKALSLHEADGALIADVKQGGPADKSGLQSGDVVTQVDGKPVATAGQFRNLIAAAGGDSKVVLTVVRGGQRLDLTVNLGTLDKEAPEAPLPDTEEGSAAEVEGLVFRNLDDTLRSRLKVAADVEGAVIVRVTPGSKAARAKLRSGDVILQINQKDVASASDALKLYEAQKGARLLQILRDGSRLFVVVK